MAFFGIEDDVFGSHRNMFRQMDNMMNSMFRDPFVNDSFYSGGLRGASSFPSLMDSTKPQVSNALIPATSMRMDPFGFSPFGGMGQMMSTMTQMGGDNCHSYSSSTVMTMQTGPDGTPQMYKATSSTKGMPGGVRETKRTEVDSCSGMQKMAIGHHIKDRSHVIQKEKTRDGGMDESQEFINLDESEAHDFNNEFMRHTQDAYGGGQAGISYHSRNRRDAGNHSYNRTPYTPALPAPSSYRRRNRPLAITSGHSHPEGVHRPRKPRNPRRH